MKKLLLIIGIVFFTSFVNSAQAQLIFSCNATGSEINTFYTNETVYVKGSSNITTTSTQVDIYIVNDNNNWANGTVLVDVSGGKKTNTTNSSGHLETMRAWSPTLTIGKYDIVVDVDRNGVYNSTVDYVDNLATTGFEVIAVPVPTLTLGLGPSNPPNHNWNLGNISYNTMLQLKLTVGPVEDVKITSIALSASGTGNDKDGVSVARLILDNGNGAYDQGETLLSYGQYIRDDGILMLNIDNGYVIPVNQTVYMIIVYTMTDSSSNGNTYSFQLASVSATGAVTGQKVTITGFPITSATKTIVAAGATTTTSTTTTTTIATTSTSTTTTIRPTTTTTFLPPLPPFGPDWITFILIMGLIPIAAVVIILIIMFIRGKGKSESRFEELKEKWKKY